MKEQPKNTQPKVKIDPNLSLRRNGFYGPSIGCNYYAFAQEAYRNWKNQNKGKSASPKIVHSSSSSLQEYDNYHCINNLLNNSI